MDGLCIKCVKHSALKRLISQKGIIIKTCNLCNSKNVLFLSIDDNDLCQLFKALIRFFYNEYEYNSHWGGSSIESLFYASNPILNNRTQKYDELQLESVVIGLTHKCYEKYEDGVTLFSGYSEEGFQNLLLSAIGSGLQPEVQTLHKLLDGHNFSKLNEKIESLSYDLTNHVIRRILKTQTFFRCRNNAPGVRPRKNNINN